MYVIDRPPAAANPPGSKNMTPVAILVYAILWKNLAYRLPRVATANEPANETTSVPAKI